MAALLRAIRICLSISLCGSPACHRGQSAMSHEPESSTPSRSIPNFRKIVSLPAEPDEVWFEQVPRGTPGGLGPTDYFLVAVMRFSPGALATVLKNGTRTGDKSPGILPAANRAWFPTPVKAAVRSVDAQNVSFRGEEFDGAPFASGAFSSGSFIVIAGGEYVLLVLTTS
ncbi:MAG TPA: hypothetical protein VMT03_20920 [Polyangia bacterium]|nr:hypothetical protein [Polyangia bacterium]